MANTLQVLVHCQWGHEGNRLLQQTSSSLGVWDGIQFHVEGVSPGITPRDCDYAIVFNWPSKTLSLRCREGGLWTVLGEPPIEYYDFIRRHYKKYDRVFSQHTTAIHRNHKLSFSPVPWHVNRSYDELSSLDPGREEKNERVTAVVSNKVLFPGHVRRLELLESFKKQKLDVDVYGRGIRALPKDDKFEVLYRSKYSLALENSNVPHYWTEKIADCFLAWSVPIYSGAPNIEEYFPKNSMIVIDASKPQEACEKIRSAIREGFWEKNISAIEEARNLVLERYQFFPFFASLIREHDSTYGPDIIRRSHVLKRPILPEERLVPRVSLKKWYRRAFRAAN